MLIKEMRLHQIAVADAPIRSSYGLHAPYALRTIVELISTDGLIGIAETYGGDRPFAALQAARPYVVGKDPFQLARLWQHFEAQAEQATVAATVAGGELSQMADERPRTLADPQAERAVLAAALLDAEGAARVIPRVATILSPAEFYDPRNATLWPRSKPL